MTNEEMLLQVTEVLEAQTVKVTGLLGVQDTRVNDKLDTFEARVNDKFDALEARVNSKFDAVEARFTDFESKFITALEAQTASIDLLIENTVTKRLDSLFDGYILAHEKQRELENRVGSLEDRIEILENQAS